MDNMMKEFLREDPFYIYRLSVLRKPVSGQPKDTKVQEWYCLARGKDLEPELAEKNGWFFKGEERHSNIYSAATTTNILGRHRPINYRVPEKFPNHIEIGQMDGIFRVILRNDLTNKDASDFLMELMHLDFSEKRLTTR